MYLYSRLGKVDNEVWEDVVLSFGSSENPAPRIVTGIGEYVCSQAYGRWQMDPKLPACAGGHHLMQDLMRLENFSITLWGRPSCIVSVLLSKARGRN